MLYIYIYIYMYMSAPPPPISQACVGRIRKCLVSYGLPVEIIHIHNYK